MVSEFRYRSKTAAVFSAFPQGFNRNYSNVSRIKTLHCLAGGAVKQNSWDFVFIADNFFIFPQVTHF